MSNDKYKPSQEHILLMLRYLRLNFPQHATPEKPFTY